jgi:hypothetical protein
MAWIKRNLFFLIGSLVALALMGVGIYYLLGQINDENQVTTDIQAQYAELSRLAGLNPHPGNGSIDNIKTAKEQEAALRDYIKKERGTFQHIQSIPDTSANKISNADFARELPITIAELRRSAQQQSVKLSSPDYDFTFLAQIKSPIADPGTLEQLASHLGEIKTLCNLLFDAKINFLDSLQREIISSNQDNNLPDYLTTQKTVTTPLADLTPYRVTFRCFSTELADVLASLATSPYGFLVQSINVESVNSADDSTVMNPTFPQPTFQPQPIPQYRGGLGRPGYPPPGSPGAPGFAPAPAPTAGHNTTFLSEKTFRVTLMIEVVKPRAAAAAK